MIDVVLAEMRRTMEPIRVSMPNGALLYSLNGRALPGKVVSEMIVAGQVSQERIRGRVTLWCDPVEPHRGGFPSTRSAAIRSRQRFYFTGVPCKAGHIAKRYAAGNCFECYRRKKAA